MTVWNDLVERRLVDRDVPLAPLTTYKLGGPARLYADIADENHLISISRAWREDPVPVLVLGRGSNLLIADGGFDGLVVHLSTAFSGFEVEEGGIVRAAGATPLPLVARGVSSLGRGGLEWFVGVPGSVGGAVRQNAGCFGSETVDRLVDCRILVLGQEAPSNRAGEQLDMAYRSSAVQPHHVVLEARFQTVDEAPDRAAATMREITRWRRDHQPGGTLNAGSVFKNPPGDAAGRIIDELGLKGYSVAGVRVSPRHANFIEAGPDAMAGDVRALIEAVREKVEAATGVLLEPEIQFVGFED